MMARSARLPVSKPALRDDPQPGDVKVTVATVLFLLCILGLMAVL